MIVPINARNRQHPRFRMTSRYRDNIRFTSDALRVVGGRGLTQELDLCRKEKRWNDYKPLKQILLHAQDNSSREHRLGDILSPNKGDVGLQTRAYGRIRPKIVGLSPR